MTFYFFEQIKEWIENHRPQTIAMVAGIGAFGVGSWYLLQPMQEELPLSPLISVETQATEATEETSAAVVFVDVKGEVKHPGVYALSPDSRVQDAIQQAGGFTEEADELQINLAQKVADQMLLIVPKKGESIAIPATGNPSNPQGKTMVNLNTATLEELQTLKGIGKKKAEQIIQYRTEHGPFKTKEEIMEVKGIGQKLFDSIQEEIVAP